MYEDIFDAKNAVDNLSGFNVMDRYLIVLYYQAAKIQKKLDLEKQKREVEALRSKYGGGNKAA